MQVTKVQLGNVYNVRAIQQAQERPVNAQFKYIADAVKERDLHPEARDEYRANNLDFLA